MIRKPDGYADDLEIRLCVDGIEKMAILGWRSSALHILWCAWAADQKRQGIPVGNGGFAFLSYLAPQYFRDQVEYVIRMVDLEDLWQAIGGFSLITDITGTDEETGRANFDIKSHRLTDFDKLVTMMFPEELTFDTAVEPTLISFPDRPDSTSIYKWAVSLMKENGVVEAYKALCAGVPLEDIIAGRRK